MRFWIIVAGLLLSVSAHAQDRIGDSGPYMGVGLGMLKYKESDDEFGIAFSDRTAAYRLFGGYQFNRNFAVEGSWGASGDLKESFSMFIPDEGTLTLDTKADVKMLTVRALGIMPFDRVALFGGIGYYDADMKVTVSIPGVIEASGKTSDDGLTLIGGAKFAIGPIDLRAEYEWFDTQSGIDTSVIGLGLSFSF